MRYSEKKPNTVKEGSSLVPEPRRNRRKLTNTRACTHKHIECVICFFKNELFMKLRGLNVLPFFPVKLFF